ncbi:L-idonate 5-dehydrogenase [Enterovirga rhinocerotis]|uniref:L-idonate 5-dehydrogenase n=1 Tax=Enterovirga rhinocerotis TaxID=1339210 RepID=A0A4V3DYS6_9HYPH|nr:L-idonate 5-dehydrogenase [Enterovirga rhinocerotis]TDR93829.1 L-idonate 5-dehydrogenase [Enterovirga rhinocerotis]
MKAVVIHPPHDLRVEDHTPEAPGPGQVAVRIRAGGICGSDLHYYRHGGFGTVRVKEPMILGHEVAGEVVAAAADVAGLKVGDRVAVNPSRPCGRCRYCAEGLFNHCEAMRFYGSAMPFPHVQGAFRETLVCEAAQCEIGPPDIPFEELALCEPLSVVLHAIGRAGSPAGLRVLVTGCGPIGALAVAVLKHGGAAEIVATDVVEEPLTLARRLGATQTIDVATAPEALAAHAAGKGRFDLLVECSGNGEAIKAALPTLRPRARMVQLGIAGGEVPLPLNLVVAKEITLLGSFRFHEEFATAARLIGSGEIDLKPLLTRTYPVEEAITAFELAGNRREAMKVHLAF